MTTDLEAFRDHCRAMTHPLSAATDAERAVWATLADEVDNYLTPEPDAPEEPLFP